MLHIAENTQDSMHFITQGYRSESSSKSASYRYCIGGLGLKFQVFRYSLIQREVKSQSQNSVANGSEAFHGGLTANDTGPL